MVAVIFDMDGVIVDSERYWSAVQEDILDEAVDTDAITPDDVRGMNVMDQYDHITEEYTVTVSRDGYFDMYDEKAEAVYTEKADLMSGFKDIISQLQEDGVPVALASSSFRHWIQMVLERFDLTDAFTVIASADDIDGRSKPAPDIYLYTAEQMDVDPSECIVVEDSAHGITAARNAGMRCVGFRTEQNQGQDLSHADTIVDGAEELQTFFAERRYRVLIEEP